MVSLVESVQEEAQPVAEEPTNEGPPVVAVRRRTIDAVLVGAGAVIAVVLVVAGSLLTWGSNFANDYVGKELTSQHINFPDRASLRRRPAGPVGYAGQQVTTGTDARAYASFIAHHLDGIANGATYADLGAPESAAKAQVRPAKDAGQSTAAVAELQTKADAITTSATPCSRVRRCVGCCSRPSPGRRSAVSPASPPRRLRRRRHDAGPRHPRGVPPAQEPHDRLRLGDCSRAWGARSTGQPASISWTSAVRLA